MRLWCVAGTSLVLAFSVAAQTLAPEVLLLSRFKSHMREELSHLPDYTCLETIARFHKEPGHPSRFQGQLSPLDTVRLEILYSNHREWYGSPGDRNLSADDPVGFIGSGLIGNGAFAMTLNNLIEGATTVYRGEELLAGRTVVKYDYHVPRLLKGLAISIASGSGTVGERGSFWLDPQSLDLIRLEFHADEIPPYLPLEEASMKVYYARTRIGEYNTLLPQQSDMHMLDATGVEDYDRLEFTHCRAFSTQSAIRFDPDPQEVASAGPPGLPTGSLTPDRGIQAVPAFLLITVQLTTPVMYKDTVGAQIEGRVSGDVMRKGKIIIPSGSVVRGRIRRLERYEGKGAEFIVGLEFTDVESSAGPMRFYADLLRIDRSPGIRPTLFERVLMPDRQTGYQTRDATITLPDLPGVASFFVSGRTFAIPRGFRTFWRTRGLIR